MRRLPQSADFPGLPSDWKGGDLYGQRNKLLEMLRCRVSLAGLPLGYGSARNMQTHGQARLCQAELGAQGQNALSEGIVALTVQGFVQGKLPFCLKIKTGIGIQQTAPRLRQPAPMKRCQQHYWPFSFMRPLLPVNSTP